VKILSSEFLPKNNHLKLNLNLIDRVLGIKARVAWCNKDRASERYNAGLEFIEMDESVKKHIDAFLK
jgi:c-di-GMP-binding flagellar brake protein YcgR